MERWKVLGIIATLIIAVSLPLYALKQAGKTATPEKEAVFVTSKACSSCHKQEYEQWSQSDHAKAMAKADEETVLGDFNNAVFKRQGVVSKFYRKNDRFFVHTRGIDGKIGDFEITHTFGWYPLQQYLIPFPGGRLQCLPIAWDSREKKWFHVYGDEIIKTNDWRYWTNGGQTWNGMCADCHSTNLAKNYDPDSGSFDTSYSEINVGCEACHGPGSLHISWAKLPEMARGKDNGLPVPTRGVSNRQQLESCALCHSRRSMTSDFRHGQGDLLDFISPRLLQEGLYYSDGQILGEVYVYGSFVQSKMYANGVHCSDCHNIHSLKLHEEGNKLCLQCHEAKFYDTRQHHFHKLKGEKGEPIRSQDGKVLFEVGSGAECVACHMPGRTYMGNDYRPDHSIRVPRPDLSIDTELPNSCNRCHVNKDARWAAEYTKKWYGEKKRYQYGTTLNKCRNRDPGSQAELIALFRDSQFPLLVRATALSLLGSFDGKEIRILFSHALREHESLLRLTALQYLPAMSQDQRLALCLPLLTDSVRSVRMEAARNLAMLPGEMIPKDAEESFTRATQELQETLLYSADFAEARMNLGSLASYQDNEQEAEKQYLKALKIDPYFFQARRNLAIIYAKEGKPEKAEEQLRLGLTLEPEQFQLHYSLGLLLAEQKKYQQAVDSLLLAARGMSSNARLFYNLGLLQSFLKDKEGADKSLQRAVMLEPENLSYLSALLRWQLTGLQNFQGALATAKQILRLAPNHPTALQVVRVLDK